MNRKTYQRARTAAHELDDVPTQLRDLEEMTVGDLAAKYRELYGEPTRTRNKQYLKKRVRWRIQELDGGGLSTRAIELITKLGDGIPERWRMRQAQVAKLPMPEAPRDPRLPPVGSVLCRVYQGAPHKVIVAIDGFDYEGERFKTLSGVAKRITGTAWNGYLFFGVAKHPPASEPSSGCSDGEAATPNTCCVGAPDAGAKETEPPR